MNTKATQAEVRSSDQLGLPPERAAFEAWAKVNRRDLDLRYMYDAQGNYHYDGYIWGDAADAFRAWRAGAEWKAVDVRERMADPLPARTVQRLQDECSALNLDTVAFAWRVQKTAARRA